MLTFQSSHPHLVSTPGDNSCPSTAAAHACRAIESKQLIIGHDHAGTSELATHQPPVSGVCATAAPNRPHPCTNRTKSHTTLARLYYDFLQSKHRTVTFSIPGTIADSLAGWRGREGHVHTMHVRSLSVAVSSSLHRRDVAALDESGFRIISRKRVAAIEVYASSAD